MLKSTLKTVNIFTKFKRITKKGNRIMSKWANCKNCGQRYQYTGDHMINEFCCERCEEEYERRHPGYKKSRLKAYIIGIVVILVLFRIARYFVWFRYVNEIEIEQWIFRFFDVLWQKCRIEKDWNCTYVFIAKNGRSISNSSQPLLYTDSPRILEYSWQNTKKIRMTCVKYQYHHCGCWNSLTAS